MRTYSIPSSVGTLSSLSTGGKEKGKILKEKDNTKTSKKLTKE